MNSNLRGFAAVLLYALFSVSLIACGSGGGGGGDGSGSSNSGGGGTAGISYAGSTNQATITDSNAVDISTSVYQSGSTGTALGSMGVVYTDDRQIGHSRSLLLSQTLKHALLQIDVTSASGASFSGTVVTDSGTIPGACPGTPGSASYSESYDNVTGNLSGSLSFHSYCSEGVRISGNANYSGHVNVYTARMMQLSISFNSLTASSGSDSFTADGNISFNFSVSPVTTTISLLMRDNSTSQVCKIENLRMALTEGSNYVDVSITGGRFYHPDHGYVDVVTSNALRIYNGNDWPSQGVLICMGNTGFGGGSTKARLTALSSMQYKVEADTTGDGLYDYNSGPLNWSDL